MAALLERRTGPRKVPLEPSLAPATQWNPAIPGETTGPTSDSFVRSSTDPGPLPSSDEDIAFARVTQLSRWIETRKLSSDRLTRICLERLTRFNPKLRCVITLTQDVALGQARQADAEIAAGRYRGPLHGIALPDRPYDSLNLILFAEAAAAFEELTLSGRADQLRAQVPDAWPNLFREARFLSAVDFV